MELGTLAGAHGLRGDLKAHLLPTAELALTQGCDILLRHSSGQLQAYRIQRCTPHKQFFLVHFEQVDDIDAAASLVGQTLLMRRDKLPELSAGQFFWSDLEGLTVVDRRRGELGRIEEMFTTPAHDILVVRSSQGEVLIPAIAPFLCQVDSETAQLRVDLPDGLVPYLDEI